MSIPRVMGSAGRSAPAWPPAPVRSDPLRSQVFDIIRDAIFAGKILPGETLRELQLAKTMGVSQSTIREALAQLEHVGLVVRQPNRGTAVTELSAKEVRDRLKIRLTLEELAISESAVHATEQDFTELEALAQAIARAIDANSFFDLGQADLAFHRKLWETADNPVLYRTLDVITTPLFAFLGVLQKTSSVSPRGTQPHEDLIAALRTREPAAAREAMRAHIVRSYGAILDSLDKDRESPPRREMRR